MGSGSQQRLAKWNNQEGIRVGFFHPYNKFAVDPQGLFYKGAINIPWDAREYPESFLYQKHIGFENVLDCFRHHQPGYPDIFSGGTKQSHLGRT